MLLGRNQRESVLFRADLVRNCFASAAQTAPVQVGASVAHHAKEIRPDFGYVLSLDAISICLHIDVLYSVLCVIPITQEVKRKVDQIVLCGPDETLELSDRLGPTLDLLRRGEHV